MNQVVTIASFLMRPILSDHDKQQITLPVITSQGFYCIIEEIVFSLKVTREIIEYFSYLEMKPMKCDHNKQLLSLTFITLSRFYCIIEESVFSLKVTTEKSHNKNN